MKTTEKDPQKGANFPLTKTNYIIILGALALLVLGFIILSGGGSDSPNEFNYEMFSTRRLVVAPLVLLAGFGAVAFGIMKRFKNEE